MSTAKESRLRRLEERAQIGKDAPAKVTRIVITDPDREHAAEIWRDESGEAPTLVGDGPITEVLRVIVDPPAHV